MLITSSSKARETHMTLADMIWLGTVFDLSDLPSRFWPEPKDVAANLIAAIISAVIVSIVAALPRSRYFMVKSFLGCLYLLEVILNNGKAKRVLLYADDVYGIKNLVKALEELPKSQSKAFSVEVLASGESFLSRPLHPRIVRAALILITDVTKLSSNNKKADIIERRLETYCAKGGTLILGHDVLYRRTRNEKLQQIAGGKIVDFEKMNGPVRYIKLSAGARASGNAELVRELPNSLDLQDREFLIGKWDNDVEYLYHLDGNPDVALVTRRCYKKGVVHWINSGDHDDKSLPPSLAQPESDLVKLLGLLIAQAG
jgi:hypothetical protein